MVEVKVGISNGSYVEILEGLGKAIRSIIRNPEQRLEALTLAAECRAICRAVCG